MKVLTTSTDAQSFKIIPKVYTFGDNSVKMTLRDDSTNEEVIYILSPVKENDYLLISNSYSLKEGRFYDVTFYTGIGDVTVSDVIYRCKVFCTDQTINQENNEYYTVNKNEYVSQSGDNDYIVI